MFFYLFPKYGFDNQDKRLFQKYFLSIGVIIIIAIVAAIVIFATTQNQSDQNSHTQNAALETHPNIDIIIYSA